MRSLLATLFRNGRRGDFTNIVMPAHRSSRGHVCRVLSLLLVLAGALMPPVYAHADDGGAETAFDRVMRTGTIRCGYAAWAPSLMVDPNSGELSGYSYDVMNAVGEKLGLDVEWVEETGWGTAEQGLVSRRYDVFCVDVCLEPPRTKAVWYSEPLVYLPFYAIVRAEEGRYDADRSLLNDNDVDFAVIPNTLLDYAAREVFPEAGHVDVNDLAGDGNVMMAIASGKADAALSTFYPVSIFNKNNPRKIMTAGKPVRICPAGFLLPRGDAALKFSIDSALGQILTSGRLEAIHKRYAPDDGRHWLLPAMPWATAYENN